MLKLFKSSPIRTPLEARGFNELVRHDDFDGPTLNYSKWECEVSAFGGGNNELQICTDQHSQRTCRKRVPQHGQGAAFKVSAIMLSKPSQVFTFRTEGTSTDAWQTGQFVSSKSGASAIGERRIMRWLMVGKRPGVVKP